MIPMKKFLKIFRLPEFYIVALLAACVVVNVSMRVTVKNVVLIEKGNIEKTSIPVTKKMREGEYFQVDLDIENPYGVSYDLKVVPDDCAEDIVVNGQQVNVRNLPGRCDFSKGFLLSDSLLSNYRVGGKTHYSFSLRNNGGNAGLNLFVYQVSAASKVVNVLAIGLFALLCLVIARRFKFGWGIALLILFGVVFRTTFYANVPYTTYSNDVDGHVAYVQYVAEKHAVPGVDDCWTCYHPPVYYVSAVPSFVLGEWLGVSCTTGLQMYSLVLSVVTLFLGILFLRTFLTGSAFGVASLLWTLWPLMILVSPRIGNDQMFYMLHVLCLWGGACYLKDGRGRYLIVAVIASALAMWTKTTAVVTLGVLLLFALFGYVRNGRSLRPSKSEMVSWIMLVLLLVGIVLQKMLGGSDLVGNASGLNSKLIVGNEAFNYIFFDLKSFVIHPYTSAWNEEWGREFFWNYSFKSAMFGEFELVRTQTGRTLATLMSVTFLGLLVYAVRGFWKSKMNAIRWILLLQTVAFFAALMFLRIKHPYSCSNDFRYIAPALLGFIPFVGLGIQVEGASVKWKVLGYVMVLGFVLSTVILYILAM